MKRTIPSWIQAVFFLMVLIIPAGCCCRGSGSTGPVTSNSNLQNTFHDGLRPFPDQYRTAPNQIKKSEIFRQANEFRAAWGRDRGTAIDGWEGMISDISTNQGGSLASVSIRCDARGLRVWYQSGMVIRRGSDLYKTLTSLTEGEPVIFSGSFHLDKERGLRETSLTESGSLHQPEFFVTFTDIARANPGGPPAKGSR